MRSFYFSCVILLACLIIPGCGSPRGYYTRPFLVEADGDYIHKQTKARFPVRLADYPRGEIISFTSDESHLSVSYASMFGMNPRITISLTPSPFAFEHRLLNHYSNAMSALSLVYKGDHKITHERVAAFSDGSKILGIRGRVATPKKNTILVCFECGRYMLTEIISSESQSMEDLVGISDRIIQEIPPLSVVRAAPFSNLVGYVIRKEYLKDSACGKPILAACVAKEKWVKTHIDSIEVCAGFPSLYLQAHKASLEAMLEEQAKLDSAAKANPAPSTDSAGKVSLIKPYMDELKYIKECGMLDEFIYDSYNELLFLPEGVVLDMEKYRKWKEKRKPKIAIIGTPFYSIFVSTGEE